MIEERLTTKAIQRQSETKQENNTKSVGVTAASKRCVSHLFSACSNTRKQEGA